MMEVAVADRDMAGRYAGLTTFRADQPEHFEESIRIVAGEVSIQPDEGSPFHTEVKLARLPRIGVFSVRCSAMRVLTADPLGFISLTIPLSREFTIEERNKRNVYTLGTAHVASHDLPFDFHAADRSHVLVANFDLTLVNTCRAKLNGGETPGELVIRPCVSMTNPQGASFWRYLSFVWSELNRGPTPLRSPIIAREMEDSLLAMFLYASEGSSFDARSECNSRVGSSYVCRAEDYIVAHLSRPVSLGDIAEAVGVNARTLSRAFKKRHGIGPIAFLKERRLESAQRMLLGANPRDSSVTEIAMQHGFCHLGQFSRDYKKAFQELPSETLRR
jgi:AraC-like DNA-binding protein